MLIEIDLHTHSVASTHAYSTVKELVQSAKENTLKGFALTDHTGVMPDAPHLWHFHNLRCLPPEIDGIRVLKGAEANIIDTGGNVDMTQRDLADLDWVIASFHIHVIDGLTSGEYTDAYINLAENPFVDAVGHPACSRFPFDYEKVVKVYKQYGKFLEINESNMNARAGAQELTEHLLRLCMQFDVPVVVSSDCHFCDSIGKTPKIEGIMRKLKFPYELIFNRKMETVLEYIAKRKKSTNE
ncbi:MAG: phosphatase [Oscillospiraceae bacterium]|jgi:putative hydrolase|nr:phosphatase [Oscillospiraceae bacterium]